MKTIVLAPVLTFALLPAVLQGMIGGQAGTPSQAVVAFDVDLDAGPGSVG